MVTAVLGRRNRLPYLAICLLVGACAHRAIAPVSAVQANHDRQVINAIDAGDGDFELRNLRARLDASPGDLSVRLQLAQRYLKLGFPEVAVEHCRLACERAPDSDEAHIALAKALRDTGRTEEGAKSISDYAAKHPAAGYKVWAWIGLLHDASGEWKAGEAAHRKAIAAAPQRDDLRNNLGYCLLRQGKKKEAVEEFRAALKIDPKSVVARNNLAAALGNSKEAAQNLQSVTDAASAHNNMAVVLIEAGEYAEARKELDVALSYNRQHSAALNNLALVSRLDGDPAQFKPLARVEGRWVRVKHAWHRLWDSEAPKDGRKPETGSSVASR